MALVNFSNLEFEQIKTSIKDYLRSNSNFTDYDFEGSNLSVIIDTLAYNTYISSYNANMLSNEVFIDSATLRENVVSLARNIGYVPRSRIAAKAAVSFFVDVSNLTINPVSLTLQKGIIATTQGRFGGVNYTFVSPDNVTVPVVDKIANFNNVNVYEGTYVTQNFTVDTANTTQRFILDNANIDTSTIRVTVKDTISSTYAQKYQLANSLFEIKPTSQVFYIQEIEDQRYELFFGDGFFGRKLQNNNYIEVSYIVTNGEDANGVDAFSFVGRVLSNNGTVVTSDISLMSVNTAATGGSEIESVASIKKYAPRIYASQSRAVTAQDYEALIPTIYPEAESVSVFGGEELNPPKYGKVFITIKPSFGPFVPNTIKDNLKTELRKYSVAGIVPEILDLKYLYIEVASKIYYNTNLAPSANYIKAIVSENVNDYADSSELNKYGARFKYSKFLKIIDDSHESITSNITLVQMRRDLRAVLNKFTEYEICFGNEFHIKDLKNGYNIKSSGFYIDGVSDVVYLSDIPNSDGLTGSLFIFKLLSDTQVKIVRKSVGVVNYKKGEVLLNPIKITKTEKFRGESLIEISAIPKSNDVIGLQDLYLQLDINNTTFDMVSDDISSGGDPAGSNYIVSSSYLNGDLVRK